MINKHGAILKMDDEFNGNLQFVYMWLKYRGLLIIPLHQNFQNFFIDNENFCSTIGIMQKNLKQYMRNSENPTGTNIINNLTALKFF
jgi:hypothetical protein